MDVLTRIANISFWQSWGLVIARLIIAAIFVMALAFKFMDMQGTAAAISVVGIPFALPLAWAAAFFELGIALAFLTGAYFRQAALLAMLYILFLAGMFHGPSMWASSQSEFGFFVDHFSFAAGLLFMIAHGAGSRWRLGWGNR